jgi:hypothetical protein
LVLKVENDSLGLAATETLEYARGCQISPNGSQAVIVIRQRLRREEQCIRQFENS